MAARRRSFHLTADPTLSTPRPGPAARSLDPQRLEVGALSIGLLALARGASAFAFSFLGCAPGVRQKTKRVPRALLAGIPRIEVAAVTDSKAEGQHQQNLAPTRPTAEPECNIIVKTLEPLELLEPRIDAHEDEDAGTGETDLGVDVKLGEPQIQTCDDDDDATNRVSEVPEDAPPPAEPLIVTDPPMSLTKKTALHIQSRANATPVGPPVGVGLGILVISPSTNERRLLSPLELRRTSPKPEFEPARTQQPVASCSSNSPHAELRASLVRQVTAFTAARISRGSSLSPPSTPRTVHLDDPFAEDVTPRAPPFVPPQPAALRCRGLQFRANQEQSPTPLHVKPARPPLRQQTVFYRQVTPPAKQPPGFWAPHPAGSRSCAILIKPPPATSTSRQVGDKENQV
ncbi:hypothetical protein C8R47DRAFT_331707 [Mycena vitilis]|nr:hypothetical protein C8R47DRAFT_331707 [Mycena vitilis]